MSIGPIVRRLFGPYEHAVVELFPGLMHLLCWASDRLLTGDRVMYHSEDELRGLVASAMPDGVVAGTSRVPPCHNNVVLTVRRAPAGTA